MANHFARNACPVLHDLSEWPLNANGKTDYGLLRLNLERLSRAAWSFDAITKSFSDYLSYSWED